MATTTTIVVTANADGSVNCTAAVQPAWGVYVANEKMQIKRILFAIKELLEVEGFNP